jgi:hypothetical protein
LIERIVSGERGAMLRSQVVAWHPGVTRDEVDEAFQEACLLAGRSCRGQTEGEVYTWLRTTGAAWSAVLEDTRIALLDLLIEVDDTVLGDAA